MYIVFESHEENGKHINFAPLHGGIDSFSTANPFLTLHGIQTMDTQLFMKAY
jgi:hypothetical protein